MKIRNILIDGTQAEEISKVKVNAETVNNIYEVISNIQNSKKK